MKGEFFSYQAGKLYYFAVVKMLRNTVPGFEESWGEKTYSPQRKVSWNVLIN